jgi:hypothetical protein
VGILGGVDPLPPLQGLTVTGGRLNVDGAVRSVVPIPDFRMDLSGPASQSVVAGESAAYIVVVAGRNGFEDDVRMSVSGLPEGAAAIFTPDVIAGTGATTLDVTTSGTTPAGSHLLTLTGTSGSRSHTLTVTLAVSRAAATWHLQGDRAGNRLLTEEPPAVGAARHADASAISRSRGNPWRPVGTWRTAAGELAGGIARVGDLAVWLGLRSSDDQGVAVDIRAVLSVDGTVIAEGEALCVKRLTRNPLRATEARIRFDPPLVSPVPEGELALTLAVRIGTGPCPGHASATGVRLYYGSAGRDSRFSVDF